MRFSIDKNTFLLIAILTSVLLTGIGASVYILFQVAYKEEQLRLTDMVKSQARLMEAVAKFDNKPEHTLSQIRQAHKNYLGSRETGEFTLAKLDNKTINFLLYQRNKNLQSSHTLPKNIIMGGQYAIPMQLALSGQSGVTLAKDYRGAQVLAAYEPISILNYGIVAKIDIAEIKKPFIKAAVLSFIIGFLLILVGSTGFRYVTRPLLDNIKRKEKEMRLLLDSTGEGIYGIDNNGLCTFANQSCIKLLGYELDSELVGNNMHELIHHHHEDGNQYPLEHCQIFKVIQEKKAISADNEFLWRKDGSKFPIQYNSSPLFENNQVMGAVVSFTDISERKNAQKYLLEKEKAEAKSQMKSLFLANMSHEIRTPMNAIIGMTQLALKTELNDKQKNYISKAYLSAENLLGILNDILDFSKIESGKLDIESIDFRLEDILYDVSNLLGLKANKKNIILIFRGIENIPTALVGDPLRLRQVLINLGNNALKFTPIGGTIDFTVKLVEENDQHTELHFSVKDTGIGMTPQQQDKLFQSFSQADSSITREYGGSGLGLSICKSLTEMMGGRIWLDSEIDVGSTFHFTLRLKKQQGKASEPVYISNLMQTAANSETLNKLKGTKILLVEDNQMNQEIAIELLSEQSIMVKLANNGQEALDFLAKENFDGVLMDCQMPVMDGYTATDKIRKQACFDNLPIIAMTANAMKEDIDKCLLAGMNDHIAKPIQPGIMFLTIAKWIQNNKATTDIMPDSNKTQLKEQAPLTQADFSNLAGIDFSKSTLKRPMMFKKYLFKFSERYSHFSEQFKQASDSDDATAPGRLAHGLKGLSATLGMINLQQQAALLEKANMDDSKEIKNLLSATISELDIVLNSIQVYQSTLSD